MILWYNRKKTVLKTFAVYVYFLMWAVTDQASLI